jgi:inorganic pyrophosphatase
VNDEKKAEHRATYSVRSGRGNAVLLEVVIDVPRGSFVKRDDDGRVDYLSPLPCPFNYGSVPDTVSGDGDRLDALVLGVRLPRGARVILPALGVVRFLDAGESDPKYICGAAPLRRRDRLLVAGFFATYAHLQGALNVLRGKRGPTRYQGIDALPVEP